MTCGSAAAVALGTAACVAGNDPVKMLRLPFTEGMVNRVIIPRAQRFAYDQAVRMIGCHIVEIDTREELDRALEEPVAMVVLLGKQEHLSAVRLEEIAAVVHPRGIPIMVDAASEHIERPSPWLRRGADLVIYSGGKFLRGPQTSGLLLGNKRLAQAAWRNGSPHQALGRPMKVSKEDIVGVIAALEYWFEERDPAAERQKWYDDCAIVAERLAQLDGVRGEIIEPEGVDRVPRLNIVWDRARFPLDGLALRQAVLDGETQGHARRQFGDREFDRGRPVPIAAGRGGAGRRRGGRGAAGIADQPAASCPAPRPGNRRDMGIARCLHAGRTYPPPAPQVQHGNEVAGHQRSPRFEGPVGGRARRRPDPLRVHRPLRSEQHLLPLRGPGHGRRDVRASSSSAPPATRTAASSTGAKLRHRRGQAHSRYLDRDEGEGKSNALRGPLHRQVGLPSLIYVFWLNFLMYPASTILSGDAAVRQLDNSDVAYVTSIWGMRFFGNIGIPLVALLVVLRRSGGAGRCWISMIRPPPCCSRCSWRCLTPGPTTIKPITPRRFTSCRTNRLS